MKLDKNCDPDFCIVLNKFNGLKEFLDFRWKTICSLLNLFIKTQSFLWESFICHILIAVIIFFFFLDSEILEKCNQIVIIAT